MFSKNTLHSYLKIILLLLFCVVFLNTKMCDAEQATAEALIEAAISGNLDKVKVLVDQGVSVDAKDPMGVTALMYAADRGHVETVRYLLRKGADVNARESGSGMTALMASAAEGHLEVVEDLLAKDADVDARDEKTGATALLGAAGWGHTAVIKALLAKGANVDAKSKTGATALLWATGNGHHDAVKALLEAGANVNARDDEYGATALFAAVGNKDEYLAKLLLDSGADTSIKAKAGLTVKDVALKKGMDSLVTLIDSYGTRDISPNTGSRPRVVLLDVWPQKNAQIESHWGYVLLLAIRERLDTVSRIINVDLSLLSRVAAGTKWEKEDSRRYMDHGRENPEALEKLHFSHATHGIVIYLGNAAGKWRTNATIYSAKPAEESKSKNFESESLFLLADQIASWLCQESGVALTDEEITHMRLVGEENLDAYQEIAKAVRALEENRAHQAIGLAKKAIKRSPNLALAHQYLGSVYLTLGQPGLAESALRESVRLDPNRVGRCNLGVLLRQKGETDAAIREYQEVIKRHPAYPHVHLLLATAYEKNNDFRNAEKEIAEAISLDPWVPDGHFNLGLLYRNQNDWENAEAAFRKAIADYPNDIQAYVMLAVTYQKRGDFENAIKILEEGVGICPDYGKAHNNLAACYLVMGSYQKAWRHVHEAQRCGFQVAPALLKYLRDNSEEPGKK